MTAKFATTRWSVVLAARDGTDTASHRALETLCEAYWFPLYAFIRYRGSSEDEAKDLTQGFFATLLEKDILQSFEPTMGRFRSFLLGSLKHFLSHEREKSRALKRGGGATTLSLDTSSAETRYRIEPAETSTPEAVFEYRWALLVMERSLDRLRRESTGSEAAPRVERLAPVLTGQKPKIPYRDLAIELEMTEPAVRGAVFRLRKRLGRILREEIAETVSRPDEIDDEVRHLLRVLEAGTYGPP